MKKIIILFMSFIDGFWPGGHEVRLIFGNFVFRHFIHTFCFRKTCTASKILNDEINFVVIQCFLNSYEFSERDFLETKYTKEMFENESPKTIRTSSDKCGENNMTCPIHPQVIFLYHKNIKRIKYNLKILAKTLRRTKL